MDKTESRLWWKAVRSPIAWAIVTTIVFSIIVDFFVKTPTDYTAGELKLLNTERFALMRLMITNTFLINGGAIIGILTFLGHWLPGPKEGATLFIERLRPALACFATALIFTILGAVAWYYDLRILVREKTTSPVFPYAERFFLFGTIWLFTWGAYFSISALKSYATESEEQQNTTNTRNNQSLDRTTDEVDCQGNA